MQEVRPETPEEFYQRTIPEVKGTGIPETAGRCETVMEAMTTLLLFHTDSGWGEIALVNWRHEIIMEYKRLCK